MKVLVSKKIDVTQITYGERLQSEVEFLENVTNIAEATVGTSKVYNITHQTGSDASPHTTSYAVDDYIISIM